MNQDNTHLTDNQENRKRIYLDIEHSRYSNNPNMLSIDVDGEYISFAMKNDNHIRHHYRLSREAAQTIAPMLYHFAAHGSFPDEIDERMNNHGIFENFEDLYY